MITRPAAPAFSPADLTTVPDRNVDAVTDLLAGLYGTVMQSLARDAVARAWMGGYLHDPGAVLLDVTKRSAALGIPVTTGAAL